MPTSIRSSQKTSSRTICGSMDQRRGRQIVSELREVFWPYEKETSLQVKLWNLLVQVKCSRDLGFRLCGAVMCNDCSDLVPFDLAHRLINPATISKFKAADDGQGANASPSKSKVQATYDGLVSNLADLAGFAESQRNFKSCQLCKEVRNVQGLPSKLI